MKDLAKLLAVVAAVTLFSLLPAHAQVQDDLFSSPGDTLRIDTTAVDTSGAQTPVDTASAETPPTDTLETPVDAITPAAEEPPPSPTDGISFSVLLGGAFPTGEMNTTQGIGGSVNLSAGYRWAELPLAIDIDLGYDHFMGAQRTDSANLYFADRGILSAMGRISFRVAIASHSEIYIDGTAGGLNYKVGTERRLHPGFGGGIGIAFKRSGLRAVIDTRYIIAPKSDDDATEISGNDGASFLRLTAGLAW